MIDSKSVRVEVTFPFDGYDTYVTGYVSKDNAERILNIINKEKLIDEYVDSRVKFHIREYDFGQSSYAFVITVIKEVRERFNLGLKDAKDAVDRNALAQKFRDAIAMIASIRRDAESTPNN